jgi:Ca2+-binding EF-hand superfamily protein
MRYLAILCLLAFAACAPKQSTFDRIDANKDGKLNQEEFQKGIKGAYKNWSSEEFDRYDTNNDGYLDRKEWDFWRDMNTDDAMRDY